MQNSIYVKSDKWLRPTMPVSGYCRFGYGVVSDVASNFVVGSVVNHAVLCCNGVTSTRCKEA